MRCCALRWSKAPIVSQFSGSRLTRRWARQFILGSRLWQMQSRTEGSTSPSPQPPSIASTTTFTSPPQPSAETHAAINDACLRSHDKQTPTDGESTANHHTTNHENKHDAGLDTSHNETRTHRTRQEAEFLCDSNENRRSGLTATLFSPQVTDTDHATAMRQAQQLLSKVWSIPVKPLDATSEQRIIRLLARYAAGEGLLEDEVLQDFNTALSLLPRSCIAASSEQCVPLSPTDDGINKSENETRTASDSASAPPRVEDPRQMLRLLQAMQCVAEGDNIHRTCYEGRLRYAAHAESLMTPFLQPALQQHGGDVWDCIREHCEGPAYAIDSITTSEVDDAIGVHTDARTGQTYFVVYVSDATVYCPFGSPLEEWTARYLATTTYLPEEVFFMLPKPIVELATLREDRPCRTFHVRFQIHPGTGELYNYSVHVGWLTRLRRITYDAVQDVLTQSTQEGDSLKGATTAEMNMPSWLTASDVTALRAIYRAAQIRFAARMRRRGTAPATSSLPVSLHAHRAPHAQHNDMNSCVGGNRVTGETGDNTDTNAHPSRISHASSPSPSDPTAVGEMDISLPDPLIRVAGTRVLSLTDQVVRTHDARLAVAELMIAANEICSRVAQEQRVTLPFRGTRHRSSEHEVADYFTEPGGAVTERSLDSGHLFFAEAMQCSVRRLSAVTRAIYAHEPLHHSGLWTSHYTHSTSPLRRYADMLVHHQLKLWLWEQHGGAAHGLHKTKANVKVKAKGSCSELNALSEECEHAKGNDEVGMNTTRGLPCDDATCSGAKDSSANESLCAAAEADTTQSSSVRRRRGGGRRRRRGALAASAPARLLEPPIPEYTMAALCANINERQEQSSLLQNSSTQFWTLRYVEDKIRERCMTRAMLSARSLSSSSSSSLVQGRPETDMHDRRQGNYRSKDNGIQSGCETAAMCCHMQRGTTPHPPSLRFLCLLGQTRRVRASPDYDRFCSRTEELVQALRLSTTAKTTPCAPTAASVPFAGRWRQTRAEYVYVSDVYIPELQLAHTMTHSCAEARVGAVVECAVTYVHAAMGVLELEMCGVRADGDERDFLRLWMGGAVSSLDA